MIIELIDIDVPYTVSTCVNDEGTSYVRISPNSAQNDRTEDWDICLDKQGIDELIRVLTFIKNEI